MKHTIIYKWLSSGLTHIQFKMGRNRKAIRKEKDLFFVRFISNAYFIILLDNIYDRSANDIRGQQEIF